VEPCPALALYLVSVGHLCMPPQLAVLAENSTFWGFFLSESGLVCKWQWTAGEGVKRERK